MPLTADALAGITPEELVATSVNGAAYDVEVFSDDGDVLVRGKKCKKVEGQDSAFIPLRHVPD